MTVGAAVIAVLLGFLGYVNVGHAWAAQQPSHALFQQIFTLNPNQNWFWSGRLTSGLSVEYSAARMASTKAGYTLETRLAEQDVEMPTFAQRDPASVAIWEDASRTFAGQAKGTVFFYKGHPRPGSVWETIEYPTLVKNYAVDKIVQIDANNGLKETVIFERHDEL